MPYSLSMDLQPKPAQNLKQLQKLIMSHQMQQAIHFLQVPIMEMTPLVEMELEQNPVLEYEQEGEDPQADPEIQQMEEDVKEESTENEMTVESELKFDDRDLEILHRLDEDFRDHFAESSTFTPSRTSQDDKFQTFLESSICDEPTLFEHLMAQAREALPEPEEIAIAETLIGNLDDHGFIKTPLTEMAILQNCTVEALEKVLEVIQTFHPCGIGARDLRESLLIQLEAQEKQGTLAFAIIEKHFDDLLHNHIPAIKKGLHCTAEEIEEMIANHIAHLDLHPGTQLARQVTTFIVPDISIHQEGDQLVVAVNNEYVPSLKLNTHYLRMLDDPTLAKDTREFIQQKVVSAKWLLRNILQRNDTLERIGQVLAKQHRDFFINPAGNLVPLTMKVVAEELEMHESTIARAVSHKYIDTPKGLLPLRYFFTSGLTTQEGTDISSSTVRDLIKDLIADEDKSQPLSDQTLSTLIKEKGIQCARRTVAKYRVALGLSTAQQRRKF